MLPIYHDVKPDVKAVARDTLASIIKHYFIVKRDSGDDFSDLFPETIYYTKKETCDSAARNIELWSRDNFERDISPLHEYALYRILKWAEDVEEDYKQENNESLFFEHLPREKLINNEKKWNISDTADMNFYYNNCFRDYDFSDVATYMNSLETHPLSYIESKFHIDLKEYTDLMPSDIEKKIIVDNSQSEKFIVEAENVFLLQGNKEVNLMSKKIGNITDSSFGDNVNLLGDNVKQNKIITVNDSLNKVFEELFKIIDNSTISPYEKQQANYNAQELQTAIQTRDKGKAKLLHSFLLNSLGSISSLLTIGQFISEKF
ncbi:hypothetical protein [Lysinibacillus parviboronicapiens]|uniref:hypothetical protein n=1 Tax=Lysinibacillus parviboronicapiens TaxID=436516 RepID=UPI000D36D731|nr:hypothetical protein [Lysinibacillus parviboronicapiens]